MKKPKIEIKTNKEYLAGLDEIREYYGSGTFRANGIFASIFDADEWIRMTYLMQGVVKYELTHD